jgi:hypothetical protein
MAAVLDFGSLFLIGFDLNLTLIERGLEDLCRTKEIQIQSSCSNLLLPIRLTKGKKSAPHGHPQRKKRKYLERYIPLSYLTQYIAPRFSERKKKAEGNPRVVVP